ncbi:MAG TPA: hypothetical protein DHV62_08120, partial [Elusimicrobia bacterium]|nr:hypothetical protein [Elusimicrobiota bacterium]
RSTTKDEKGELTAILVPHAGYIFSGQVAAYGFKLLEQKKFDTVILIGLAHRYHLGNKAAVYPKGYFQTPLGKIKIDEDIANKLCQLNPLIEKNVEAHQDEHSLEVELPFLQKIYTSNQPQIVPILIGNSDLNTCRKIGETIAEVISKDLPTDLSAEAKAKEEALAKAGRKTKNILLICSSDMSHYPEYSRANRVDKMALAVLERLNPIELKETIDALLLQGIPNLHCVFCAEGALFTTIYAVKKLGANEVKVLHYANSGDVKTGMKNQVVGYTAVAFLKGLKKTIREEEKMKTEFKLSPEAQKELLTLARESIESSLEGKKTEFTPKSQELKNLGAVFVTLRKREQLRGCIGTTMARRAIYEEVAEMACAAAFQDYRFPPVKKEELKDIKIEISVLSPLEKVKSAEEIKPKIHGVYLRQGNYAGLFLPRVWEETGWNKEEFLSNLASHKAGLPEDAWKNTRTDLYIFTVFSFEEK